MAFISPLGFSSFTPQRRVPLCTHRPHPPVIRMSAVANIPDVLAKILERKATEVAALRKEVDATGPDHPVAKALAAKGSTERSKHFVSALTLPKGSITVIAEVKRRSPSKGQIGFIKDPGNLSRVYMEAGAGAISVLTDLEGFGGTMEDLEAVVETQAGFKGNYPGPCPVLRKDFIIDEIQIAQAAAGGASAILLIVAALGKEKTKELLDAAHGMGLDALVEVHSEEELEIALEVGAEVVGVNNRDLRTFKVSLDTSFNLLPLIPDSVIKVAESGLEECDDVWKLRDAGFNAVLTGEVLVRAAEGSGVDGNSYTAGYNQAAGLIRAFKSKGTGIFGKVGNAEFYGKGEGASESLGEISI